MATTAASVKRRKRPRPALSRERVLTEALRLVDEDGLEALTMRALGARLGVEAMALYNHVPSKQALHDGIGELLWAELERSVEPQDDWRRSVRALADGLRRLAREHPNAYALLFARRVSPAPGLRTFRSQLETLRAAGFDDSRAADILRAVVGYAMGYALLELSSLSVSRSGGEGQDVDLDSLWALARSLPPDLPPDLADVARAVCLCDMNRQFDVGLDALLAGLDPDCNTR
jgi:TetR/AcrR family transcriptional regulator, tetracycline repressor protein